MQPIFSAGEDDQLHSSQEVCPDLQLPCGMLGRSYIWKERQQVCKRAPDGIYSRPQQLTWDDIKLSLLLSLWQKHCLLVLFPDWLSGLDSRVFLLLAWEPCLQGRCWASASPCKLLPCCLAPTHRDRQPRAKMVLLLSIPVPTAGTGYYGLQGDPNPTSWLLDINPSYSKPHCQVILSCNACPAPNCTYLQLNTAPWRGF